VGNGTFPFRVGTVHQENHLQTGNYLTGYNKRSENLLPKEKDVMENYGTSPRKGAQSISSSPNTAKRGGYSPGTWMNDGYKEKSRKRIPEQYGSPHSPEKAGPRFNIGSEGRHLRQLTAPPHWRKRSRKIKRMNEQFEDISAPVIDESKLTKEERLGLCQAEERLGREFIYRLKRRARSCPTAKYTCKLCDVLIESVSSAHKHIKEKRHKKYIKEKREEEMLTMLPPPRPSQVKAIDAAIEKVVKECGITENDVIKRHEITKAMEKIVHQLLPDCSLRLYGSSCTRFGFSDSDLNIDIQFPVHMNQPDVLLLVQESLKNSITFIDVEAEFHARVPVVLCREKQSGLLCKVSAGNENAWLTTCHLATLAKLEPRLTPLVTAFRYWGKVRNPFCLWIFFVIEGFSLDNLANFSLKGVEDNQVIWELKAVSTDDVISNEGKVCLFWNVALTFREDEQSSSPMGQLWVELLRFYALEFALADYVIGIRIREPLSREAKDWPKRRIAIEDPYSVKRNVARTLNSQMVYDYIIHCLRATYKYFALPKNKAAKCNRKGNTKVDSESTKKLDSIKTGGAIPAGTPNGGYLQLHTDSDKINAVDSFRNEQTIQNCGSEGIAEEELISDFENILITSYEPNDKNHPEQSEDKQSSDDVLESGNDEERFDMPGKQKKSSAATSRVWEEDKGNHSTEVDKETSSDEEMGTRVKNSYFRDNFYSESLSDSEGFLNPQNMECDEFGLEDCSQQEGKDEEEIVLNDEDRESSDSVDLLPCTPEKPMHQLVGAVSRNEEDEEDDEEEEEDELDLNISRIHLDTTSAKSQDGATAQLFKHSVDNEVTMKQKQELQLDEMNKETLHQESQTSGEDDMFYTFNRIDFTKGKASIIVCNLCKREGHLKQDCPEDFKKVDLDPLPQMTPIFLEFLDQVCFHCYKDFSPDSLEIQAREHILLCLEDFIRTELDATANLCLFGSSKNGFGFKQSDLDICMTFEGRETAEGLNCIRIIEDLARVLRKHPGLRSILPITTAKVPIVKFFHVRSGLEGDISLYNTLALHNTGLLASYAAIDPRVKYLGYTMKIFAKICDIGDASRGSLSSYAYTLMALYFLQQRKPPVIPVLQEIFDGEKKSVFVDGWNVYYFDKLDELKNRWPDYGKNEESVGELWLGLLRFYTEEFDFKEHVISIRRKNLLTTFKKQWTSKYIVIEGKLGVTNFIMKALINGRKIFGTPVRWIPKEYPAFLEYFFDPEILTEGEVAPNDRCCRICGKIGHFMKDCPMRRCKTRRRENREDVRTKMGLNDQFQKPIESKPKRKHEEKEPQNKDVQKMYRESLKDVPKIEGELYGEARTPRKTKEEKVTNEILRDRTPRQYAEQRRKQEQDKRCFTCGKEGHIKKECPQYKGITLLFVFHFPGGLSILHYYRWIGC
uniref:Terminal uridylyl transferase 7 n=1 Tax=Callorhinchus milii TaxID=7868 RepID=A0A4W3GYP1_CALMI